MEDSGFGGLDEVVSNNVDANVAALDAGVARKEKSGRTALLFTQSRWHAISHISGVGVDASTAVECGYPDPWEVFPFRVMRMVDYGIQHAGLECFVIEYKSASTGKRLGVILYLFMGERDVGCYAWRDDGRGVKEGSPKGTWENNDTKRTEQPWQRGDKTIH